MIWSETTVTAPDGRPLWTQKRSIFARGEGGFGGERGPSTSSEPPERAPDLELDIPTLPQQALLYRLCGDRNPAALRSRIRFRRRLSAADPARAVHLRHDVQGDRRQHCSTATSRRSPSYGARFAGVVFPGETLRASIWKEGDGFAAVSPRPSATTQRAVRRGAHSGLGLSWTIRFGSWEFSADSGPSVGPCV